MNAIPPPVSMSFETLWSAMIPAEQHEIARQFSAIQIINGDAAATLAAIIGQVIGDGIRYQKNNLMKGSPCV